jgi:uncharacterized repeat protein (TIGR03803 family)
MTKLGGWKNVFGVFLLCAATSIAAPAQNYKDLVVFNGSNGDGPVSALVQGVNGNLYGTVPAGGATFWGAVYEMSPAGAYSILYSFCPQTNCTDGSEPAAALTLGLDGNFYGTTESGGAYGYGTVFKITASGKLTTLYSFCTRSNCADGAAPLAGLIQASDGNFYGAAAFGGQGDCSGLAGTGCGTIFKITSAGKLTTLHVFDVTDGGNPEAGLIQATDGNFYGTTVIGGANGDGTVFRMTPAGKLTTLHSFNNTDGANPYSSLTQATDGNLYGTTNQQGANGNGTVFKITLAGKLTTIHNFCSLPCTSSVQPYAGLVQATDGNLYGTTYWGGDLNCNDFNGCGTVYRITPAGNLTTLYRFNTGIDPFSAVFQATNGTFYGTTLFGGNYNCGFDTGCGTIFSLSMGLGPFVSLERYSGRVGQTGGILGQGFKGTTGVMLNGTLASFTVVSDTFLKATVPAGATSGFVTVVTPNGTLKSDKPFQVLP